MVNFPEKNKMNSSSANKINAMLESAFKAGWRSAHIYSQKVDSGETEARAHEYLDFSLADFMTKRGMKSDGSGGIVGGSFSEPAIFSRMKRIAKKVVDFIEEE